jgi:hypothetical protein
MVVAEAMCYTVVGLCSLSRRQYLLCFFAWCAARPKDELVLVEVLSLLLMQPVMCRGRGGGLLTGIGQGVI